MKQTLYNQVISFYLVHSRTRSLMAVKHVKGIVRRGHCYEGSRGYGDAKECVDCM